MPLRQAVGYAEAWRESAGHGLSRLHRESSKSGCREPRRRGRARRGALQRRSIAPGDVSKQMGVLFFTGPVLLRFFPNEKPPPQTKTTTHRFAVICQAQRAPLRRWFPGFRPSIATRFRPNVFVFSNLTFALCQFCV